jgi:hypothetical protein
LPFRQTPWWPCFDFSADIARFRHYFLHTPRFHYAIIFDYFTFFNIFSILRFHYCYAFAD